MNAIHTASTGELIDAKESKNPEEETSDSRVIGEGHDLDHCWESSARSKASLSGIRRGIRERLPKERS